MQSGTDFPGLHPGYEHPLPRPLSRNRERGGKRLRAAEECQPALNTLLFPFLSKEEGRPRERGFA